MIRIEDIQGIIFDYGGTIDSNGMHWAEVIWIGYEKANVPVSKEDFRDAYVYGERALAKTRYVLPHHTFRNMLDIKIPLQLQWLAEHGKYTEDAPITELTKIVVEECYQYARNAIENARPVIEKLKEKYPMVLVSNFYGNIESVLKDFTLDHFFDSIIESAVVGVRKPDPEIFAMGLRRFDLSAGQVVVIGDSYDKDIIPATTLGCQTIWLKSIGWSAYKGNESADAVISDFTELNTIFSL